MHGSMMLTGFGTVFLGPILPVLAQAAHTTDVGSGWLFTAQFVGSLLGGATINARLWFCLLRGYVAALVGFALLALSAGGSTHTYLLAAALLPLGFGVGQMLTALNLIVSRQPAERRGSALTLLNLSWSVGAVLAPVVLGLAGTGAGPRAVLYAVAALFATGLALAWLRRGWGFAADRAHPAGAGSVSAASRLPRMTFVFYAVLLLIFGGVETSISGWLTTFETRYGGGALSRSTWSTGILWIGIAVGRAVVLGLLRFREDTVRRGALAVAAVAMLGLANAEGSLQISLWAALLGLSLAPWFPLLVSTMTAEGTTPGEAGKIIATSAIGAATVPWLVGVLSRFTGSLRIGLLLPYVGLMVLLTMDVLRRQPGRPATTPAQGV